jgi:hypothetical protein
MVIKQIDIVGQPISTEESKDSGCPQGHKREAGVSPAWSRHCKQEDDFHKATRRLPGKAEGQEQWLLAPPVSQETYPELILNLRRVETGSDRSSARSFCTP